MRCFRSLRVQHDGIQRVRAQQSARFNRNPSRHPAKHCADRAPCRFHSSQASLARAPRRSRSRGSTNADCCFATLTASSDCGHLQLRLAAQNLILMVSQNPPSPSPVPALYELRHLRRTLARLEETHATTSPVIANLKRIVMSRIWELESQLGSSETHRLLDHSSQYVTASTSRDAPVVGPSRHHAAFFTGQRDPHPSGTLLHRGSGSVDNGDGPA